MDENALKKTMAMILGVLIGYIVVSLAIDLSYSFGLILLELQQRRVAFNILVLKYEAREKTAPEGAVENEMLV